MNCSKSRIKKFILISENTFSVVYGSTPTLDKDLSEDDGPFTTLSLSPTGMGEGSGQGKETDCLVVGPF